MSATVTAKNSFAGAEVAALLPVHIGAHDSVDLNLIHLFGVNGLGSAPFQALQSLPLVGMHETPLPLGDFAAGVVLADSDFCLHRGFLRRDAVCHCCHRLRQNRTRLVLLFWTLQLPLHQATSLKLASDMGLCAVGPAVDFGV